MSSYFEQKAHKLIAQGNHDEIMACLVCGYLEDEQELLLLKCGNHEEIMTYISNQEFYSSDSELAFVERGNDEELMAYALSHALTSSIKKTLVWESLLM